MPRSPENVVPFRGPFGGLLRGPATRIPPDRTYECLNVLNRDGDIRRRAGQEIHVAPSWPTIDLSPPYVFERPLRIMPYFYGAEGDDPPTLPYALVTARYVNGVDSRAEHLLVDLNTGAANIVAITMVGSESDDEPKAFRFGYEKCGKVFVIRGRVSTSWRAVYRKAGETAWTTVYYMLPRPPLMGTGSAQGGGNLPAGTYEYTYCYVNSETGSEGPAQLEQTTTVTLSSTGTARVPLTYSSLNGVDKIKIYRRQSSVDTEFYFLKQIDNLSGTGYFDDTGPPTVPTPVKTADYVLDLLTGYNPGQGDEVAAWRGRLWCDCLAQPNVVYFSDYEKPWSFRVTNARQCGNDPSDTIQRMLPVSDVLVVLKRDSIWTVTGSGEDSFETTELARGVGLAGINGAQVVNGVLYFCGFDGLYAVTESSLTRLSDAVRELWERYRDVSYRTLAHDPERDLIVVHGYTGANLTEPLTLAYHIPSEQWYRWDLNTSGVGTLRLGLQERPRLALIAASGTHAGKLAVMRREHDAEQRDYGTEPVAWHHDIGPIDFGTKYAKHLAYAALEWARDADAEGEDLILEVATDQAETGVEYTVQDDAEPPGAEFTLGRVCHAARFRVKGQTARRPRVTGIEVEATAVGQR